MISIYKITHKETGKCYIGQAQDVQKRWKKHCSLKSGCPKLSRAIQKYGKDTFEFKVLFICSEKDADWYETLMISGYNSIEDGYNICPVGGSVMRGRNHSDETRKKMSDAAKNMSDEHKKKLSDAKKGKYTGENNPASKLSDTQREEIKALYATGDYSQRKLAKLYSVSQKQISNITRGSNEK